mgnify:CR=1 FL=1
MKKAIVSTLLLTVAIFIHAQDSASVQTTDKPVRNIFYSNTLCYQQTVASPVKGSMELFFSHRFGAVDNGFEDLLGLYGGVNIRMSLAYGITDKIMVGLGSTMPNTWDMHGKIALFRQTKSNSIPVSVSLFANAAVDARNKSIYDIYTTYSYKHRFSYYYQLMIARKFGNIATFQVSPVLAYYNAVEKDKENMNVGVDFLGRVKLTGSVSLIGQYCQSFTKTEFKSYPGAGLGAEITTPTHSFQVFLSNYHHILQQSNLVNNKYSLSEGGSVCIGFNLTIRL